MVNWLMTFAFDYIKHIKYIKLAGYIKTSQKEMWMGILSKHRKGEDSDFDAPTAIASILGSSEPLQ